MLDKKELVSQDNVKYEVPWGESIPVVLLDRRLGIWEITSNFYEFFPNPTISSYTPEELFYIGATLNNVDFIIDE